jgi:large repetitive protein
MRPSSGILSTTSVIGPNSIPIGEWHHLAATFDGNKLQLIVNGELTGSATAQTSPFNQATLRTGIGAFVATNGSVFGAFHGFIDEVRMWNHARSVEEINADLERTK